MTAFYILGSVLAGWALLVTALGIMRKDFPGSKGAERVVTAISVVLVAAAVGSAIIGAANEEEEHPEEAVHAAESEEQQPAGEGGAQRAAQADEGEEGSPPGEQAATEGQTLELEADPTGQLAFTEDVIEATAGPVEIAMTNPSGVPHNVAVEGNGVDVKGDVVQDGDVSKVVTELEAGNYTFYCSVPGHREGGMEGTLTVQ